MNCEKISTGKLDTYINNPEVVLIDLRSNIDYRKYHIKNAINISLQELQNELKQNGRGGIKLNGKRYGHEYIYILYCERGAQSMMACAMLAQYGYKVKTVVGGITHYNGKYLVY